MTFPRFHHFFMKSFMSEIKKTNYGVYSALIDQYLEYKRSLGFKMGKNCECYLRLFDRFTIDRGEERVGISKELMDEWSKFRPNESEMTRYARLSAIKAFSVYLVILGYEAYIPKLPKFKYTFTPHIYTQSELSAIFRECDKLMPRQNRIGCPIHIMPTLIRMLYGTGIRISEALSLTHGDVNVETGILWLRNCKNGRERIVPMSTTLTEVCKDYIAYKERLGLNVEPQKKFFVSRKGEIQEDLVREYFKTVLYKAGISQNCRLHDLRHTAASNALIKMSSSGMDLYSSLPILMTYLGHQSLRATSQYLHITYELYPQLLKKVNEIGKYVFPEICYEIENEEEL